MTTPQEPMLDVAHGDPARSAFLRAALRRLRESSRDERFQALVDDILAGRSSLRAAATSDVFNRSIAAWVDEGARRYQELPEEERDELAARGEQEFAALREELSEAPSTDRAPDDDDDGYGGSIMRKGW
jgi:hypothetical protein